MAASLSAIVRLSDLVRLDEVSTYWTLGKSMPLGGFLSDSLDWTCMQVFCMLGICMLGIDLFIFPGMESWSTCTWAMDSYMIEVPSSQSSL